MEPIPTKTINSLKIRDLMDSFHVEHDQWKISMM
jgi:hypothetical protein